MSQEKNKNGDYKGAPSVAPIKKGSQDESGKIRAHSTQNINALVVQHIKGTFFYSGWLFEWDNSSSTGLKIFKLTENDKFRFYHGSVETSD